LQNGINKKIVLFIVAILALSTAASAILITPVSAAHNPVYQYTTYAKIQAFPDPIGVGQSALVYVFLANAPPSGSAISNTYRFHNYDVVITDPNGQNQTFHWDTCVDTTGAQFFRFTPDIVGTYTLTFYYRGQTQHYPADISSTASEGDVYLPSTATQKLTVTQDPAKTYPDSYPLPTEYWTRPIFGENQYWFTISSNWYGAGSPVKSDVSGSSTVTQVSTAGSMQQRYPGDAIGSLTSHVMWTKAIQEGGVVGDDRFEVAGDTYFEGSAYNNRVQNPIIMYGRLFYREPFSYGSTSFGTGSGESICVDLRTGNEIWRRTDLPTFAFGWTFDVQSPNQHGVFPAFLCTSNFANIFDMWTGKPVFNVSSVPSSGALGTTQGPVGEVIKYFMVNNGTTAAPSWYLCSWNTSKLFTGTGFASGTGLSPAPDLQTPATVVNWTTTQIVNGVSQTVITQTTSQFVNGSRGVRYDWLNPTTQNQSISWRDTQPSNFSPTSLSVHYGDMILCRNGTYASITGVTQNTSSGSGLVLANWTYFAINLNPDKGAVGSVLWWNTISSPVDKTITYGGADPTARVFIEVCKETSNMIGYSMDTGQKLWETNTVNDIDQQAIAPLDYFGNPSYPYVATNLAYGKIYSLSYGGILFCYDLETGQRLWTNGNGHVAGNDTDTGTSVPGYFPAFVNAIGNDVIYCVATQHTTITPLSKGQQAYAVNATSGLEIWRISDYTGEFTSESYAMADGYNIFLNGLDNRIYCVGKGPTTMTVDAPNLAATSGQAVVISGSVLDISAGAKEAEQSARFPNGIPCAVDAIMGDWMGYVFQQKPLPSNFMGVTVDISVFDSNGNYRSIGTTTTDAKGNYQIVWTPDISGTYNVVASFAGTNSYWPASSTAAFTVSEPEATVAPTPTQSPSMSDLYFVPAIAGLFVFVAIIGVVIILLVLKKRP
jgi:hypothetical protein